MSSAPDLPAPGADPAVYYAPRPPQLPFALHLGDAQRTIAGRDGAHEPAELVCGFLGCDARPFNPLLAALPRMLHVQLGGEASWVGQVLRIAADESHRRSPGGEAVLERMSEMMFIAVLRRFVDTLPDGQTGWLAGLRDPGVGRALALLHQRPGDPWTLESLGESAGLSRSVLHERFVHFIGQPPIQYLASWRMQLAAARLRDSDAKLIEIALDVGYESEAAFSRAFKRVLGAAPGAWRRARRDGRTPAAAIAT
jgi:AraC-like DNA-binding protein